MRKNNLNVLFSLLALMIVTFWLTSCTKYKEIAYFQDVPKDGTEVYADGVPRLKEAYKSIKIKSGDILQITIQTIAPAGGTDLGASSFSSANLGGEGSTSGLSGISGYLVDDAGDIELPLVGKMSVKGLTLGAIKEQIRGKAERYYKDPVINVRLANFKVTVLGEVANPGTYILDQEKVTLLDALGQAGDLTITGKRINVLLKREIDGREQMVRLNLNSTDLFKSPYYYLQQGDVLYIEPSRSRAAANDAFAFQFYSAVISSLSLIATILLRVR